MTTNPIEWTDHRFSGWAMRFATRNIWKVAPLLDLEDLVQELAVTFVGCSRKYPNVEAKHFMALFKSACNRRVIDLARFKKRRPELVAIYNTPSCSRRSTGVPCIEQALINAPVEVHAFLNAVLEGKDTTHPKGYRSNLMDRLSGMAGTEEVFNSWIATEVAIL